MKYMLALDQGTTSSRAMLFNRQGAVIAMAQREFSQLFPQPGWVEHDAEEIWSSQLRVARAVLKKAQVTPQQIAGLGITNQRETTVLWDRETGKPLANAIVWQDRRTAGICDKLRANGDDELIRQRTGLVLDPYFSATKIQWLLKHVKGARAAARAGRLAFGTIDAWLVWRLTNGRLHVTDPSNASRTMLYDIHKCQWDEDLLQLFGIPESILPEVRTSSEVYGETKALGAAIPIAGIAGDQQAALFGQVCTQAGMAKNTYGTGCFLLMNTGTEPVASPSGLLTTVAWRIGKQTHYALEGSIFIAGAAVQWLRDGLHLVRQAADIEGLASQVADSGGLIVVPAFAGLGAPHWDAYARGAILGITRGTTAAHVARATLEGIAFQVADVLAAMQLDSNIRLKELRVDGGASQNSLLMQFQADLLGVPIVRPAVGETTALGAAYLAGLAVGYWEDVREVAAQWQVSQRYARDEAATAGPQDGRMETRRRTCPRLDRPGVESGGGNQARMTAMIQRAVRHAVSDNTAKAVPYGLW